MTLISFSFSPSHILDLMTGLKWVEDQTGMHIPLHSKSSSFIIIETYQANSHQKSESEYRKGSMPSNEDEDEDAGAEFTIDCMMMKSMGTVFNRP